MRGRLHWAFWLWEEWCYLLHGVFRGRFSTWIRSGEYEFKVGPADQALVSLGVTLDLLSLKCEISPPGDPSLSHLLLHQCCTFIWFSWCAEFVVHNRHLMWGMILTQLWRSSLGKECGQIAPACFCLLHSLYRAGFWSNSMCFPPCLAWWTGWEVCVFPSNFAWAYMLPWNESLLIVLFFFSWLKLIRQKKPFDVGWRGG